MSDKYGSPIEPKSHEDSSSMSISLDLVSSSTPVTRHSLGVSQKDPLDLFLGADEEDQSD